MSHYGSAVADFRRARSQADLQQLLSLLKGETQELLSYDEVRQKLKLIGGVERGLRDIPLDAIVGSVGRYSDFTRDFLPRRDSDKERWASVKAATATLAGLPPIDVYQIGEVFFVKDGNHRVSVARQMGSETIQAYVTEVHSRVPLTPDLHPDDLIQKAEQVGFLEVTRLDRLRPESDFTVTIPGQYQALLEHIEVHRYFMGLDFQRDISYAEAVEHWYDVVYLPVIELIRDQGILRDFPGRTETDLYLFIAEYRAQLELEFNWSIKTEYAASELVNQQSQASQNLIQRMKSKLFDLLIPDKLESGPPPGKWRAEKLGSGPEDQWLNEILVPVDGSDSGWFALEQALVIARRENAQLRGLFVVPEAELNDEQAQSIRENFVQRCQAANIAGNVTLALGETVPQICRAAALTDMIVINLSYPPPEAALARYSSGFRELIQRCSRPILVTPRTTVDLVKPLLAYDGSPKAEEALFISTYLASRWQFPLHVISVSENSNAAEHILQRAREYIQAHSVEAVYLAESGSPGEKIIEASQLYSCDFIIIGGYRHSPVLDLLVNSTVDEMLRESCTPVLICR